MPRVSTIAKQHYQNSSSPNNNYLGVMSPKFTHNDVNSGISTPSKFKSPNHVPIANRKNQ